MDRALLAQEKELVALESHIQSIFALGENLKAQGMSVSFALEADRLVDIGSSTFSSLHFGAQTKSEKLTLAMESIVSSIWEHIKAFFKKVVEYLKKAWAWLTKQEKDLTESKLVEAADASRSFSEEAKKTLGEIQGAKKKKKGEKKDAVPATEDASAGDHASALAVLTAKAEQSAQALENSLTTAEKLILFSDSYVSEMDALAKRFSRGNPVEQLASKYQRMNESLDRIFQEARAIDASEDYSTRREGLDTFKTRLEEIFKAFHNASWEDAAKAIDEDIVKFHGARDGSKSEGFSERSVSLDKPDQLVNLIGNRQVAFVVVKDAVATVKFTLDELKKTQAVFEALVKKIEAMEASGGVKHHDAQSYAAQCLLTEAHTAIGQIKCVAQGIAIFPLYFNDAHSALNKLQKHVLSVFGATVKAMVDSDDFETDLVRTQYDKLRQTYNRFSTVRSE